MRSLRDSLRVSVIMPVYNACAFVEEATRSILEQTYEEFEFVIVDDGSSDGSPEIVEGLGDSRVRLIRRDHEGTTAALNAGLEVARGGIVVRMDADDVSHPTRLAEQVEHFATHPDIDVLAVRDECIDREGNPREPEADDEDACWADPLLGFARRNFIVHGSVAVRRSAFDEVGLYGPELPCAQDYDLWVRMAMSGKVFRCLDKGLYRRRIHAGAVSRRCTALQHEIALRIRVRLIESLLRRNLRPADALLPELEDCLNLAFGLGRLDLGRHIARVQMRLEPHELVHKKNYLLTLPGVRRIRDMVRDAAGNDPS